MLSSKKNLAGREGGAEVLEPGEFVSYRSSGCLGSSAAMSEESTTLRSQYENLPSHHQPEWWVCKRSTGLKTREMRIKWDGNEDKWEEGSHGMHD